MKITQPAHARLQIAIREWMRNEIPESKGLFEEHKDADYRGVVVGDTVFTESHVSKIAASAAYTTVIQAIEMLGLDQQNNVN